MSNNNIATLQVVYSTSNLSLALFSLLLAVQSSAFPADPLLFWPQFYHLPRPPLSLFFQPLFLVLHLLTCWFSLAHPSLILILDVVHHQAPTFPAYPAQPSPCLFLVCCPTPHLFRLTLLTTMHHQLTAKPSQLSAFPTSCFHLLVSFNVSGQILVGKESLCRWGPFFGSNLGPTGQLWKQQMRFHLLGK